MKEIKIRTIIFRAFWPGPLSAGDRAMLLLIALYESIRRLAIRLEKPEVVSLAEEARNACAADFMRWRQEDALRAAAKDFLRKF